MSDDKSRRSYAHIGCGTLPCSCTFNHKPITIETLTCPHDGCGFTDSMATKIQRHHLIEHEADLAGEPVSFHLYRLGLRT